MKKLIFIVILVMTFMVLVAQEGGFRGPRAEAITVEQAKTLRDDAAIILRGYIEKSLGNERYLFSDETGSITIEIERKVWGSLTVDENDLIEISGEIDREWNRIEVEVKTITKL